VRLWRSYFTAVLEEFACQERLSVAKQINDDKQIGRLQSALGCASAHLQMVVPRTRDGFTRINLDEVPASFVALRRGQPQDRLWHT